MNIQPLFENITDKWIVKVFCFVIALVLFFVHQTASVERKSFIVPLSVKEDGAVVSTNITDENSNRLTTVKLDVRAEADDLAKIEARKSDLKAYVDISAIGKAGIKKVPVYLELPDDLKLIEPLEIASIPESVFVKTERLMSRYIPIKPSITGEVDRGYIQNDITVVPNSVFVSGPESIVSELSYIITENIDVVNHYDTFSARTSLVNLNKAIKINSPEEIMVRVGIAAVKDVKLFDSVPVQFVGIRPEVRISEKSAEQTVSVNLSGNLLFLERLSATRIIARADCSKITTPGEYELSVSISVPSGSVNADKDKKIIRVVFESSAENSSENEKAENDNNGA